MPLDLLSAQLFQSFQADAQETNCFSIPVSWLVLTLHSNMSRDCWVLILLFFPLSLGLIHPETWKVYYHLIFKQEHLKTDHHQTLLHCTRDFLPCWHSCVLTNLACLDCLANWQSTQLYFHHLPHKDIMRNSKRFAEIDLHGLYGIFQITNLTVLSINIAKLGWNHFIHSKIIAINYYYITVLFFTKHVSLDIWFFSRHLSGVGSIL